MDPCRLGEVDRQALYYANGCFRLLNNARLQLLATPLGHNSHLKQSSLIAEDMSPDDEPIADDESNHLQSRKNQTQEDITTFKSG
jgi:hypothetical protein